MSKPMDDRTANDGRRLVSANGVEICTEAFGDPAGPPVLLVIGATASMLWGLPGGQHGDPARPQWQLMGGSSPVRVWKPVDRAACRWVPHSGRDR